ncbi:MAG: hypothetical protein B1H12_04625 [Desulfobacteraceae bacterium 4484_190.2]|nr:MAG: hypothetical protein B1H12_04625 [Desulfobacteraceae bacterium 4484_190.2]
MPVRSFRNLQPDGYDLLPPGDLVQGMPIRLAQIPKFYRIRGITDLATGRAFRYPKGYLIAPDGRRRPRLITERMLKLQQSPRVT